MLLGMAACRGSGESPSRAGGDPVHARPRPSRSEPAGNLVFLLPGELPGGFEVESTQVSSGPNLDPGGTRVVVARPDPAGKNIYLDPVAVLIAPASKDLSVSPDEEAQIERVEVRGVTARIADQQVGVTADWFEQGKAVLVVGPKGSRRLVLEVARGLRPDAAPEGVLTDLPKGYVVLARHSYEARPSPDWTVRLIGPAGAVTTVSGSLVAPGQPPVLEALPADRVEVLTVRGASAVLASRSAARPGDPARSETSVTVSWLERPNMAVTVTGTITRQLAVEIAERLREVDSPEFHSFDPAPSAPPSEPDQDAPPPSSP